MATKKQLARSMYSTGFDNLSPGEKAAVTRAFNAQGATASVGSVSAEIGRIGVNGTQRCILSDGASVKDLLDQSGYTLDKKKEGIIAQSTGRKVSLSSNVVNGETYVITPEIKSA